MTQTNNLDWYENLIKCSNKEIKLEKNDKGIWKKTYGIEGLRMGWNKITKTDIIKGHEGIMVRTGEINNIIVVDFDDVALYEKFVNTYNNIYTEDGEPVFGRDDYPTVKTKNGFHIYFEYNSEIKQPDKDILKIDIQGNNKFVFGAGTKYPFPDELGGGEFIYEWIVDEELQPMPQRLIDVINKEGKVKHTTPILKAKPDKPDEEDEPNPADIKKLKEVADLIGVEYINNRDTWLKILYAFKYEGIDEEYALEFSRRSNTVEIADDDFDKTWKSLGYAEGNQATAGTIYHYAKLSNPEALVILNKKHKPIKEFNLDKPTERSFATLYDTLEGNNIVYCEDDGEFYCWFKNKWRIETKDSWFVRTMVSNCLTDYFSKMLITIRLNTNADPQQVHTDTIKIFEIMKMIEKTNWLNNIWKELQSIVICKCEKVEFDMNPDVIGFNNKKYNYKTKEWSDIVYDDFISLNTGNEWVEPTKKQTETITKLFEEIFPDAENRRSYVSILYASCIGGKKDKFVIANGGGANGKGLINEAMKTLLGEYAYEAPVSLLTREFKSGANPELSNIHKKRLVLFKEPDATEKLFLGNIKTLVDNDTVNARQLYKSNCKVVLNATVIMELNIKLKFSGKPTNAETRRFMDILFESTFTDDEDKLNDKTLSNIHPMNKHYKTVEFQKSIVCALFKYITDNADTEIYNPECVRKRTNCYIEGEDTFANWYKEEYEMTGNKNDCITIKDMFANYKMSDDYQNTPKPDRPNLIRFKTFFVKTDNNLSSRFHEEKRINNHKYKSVFIGMKVKEEVAADDDDDDDAADDDAADDDYNISGEVKLS